MSISEEKKNNKIGRPRNEKTRVKILQTAIKLLIEEGYHKTTMKLIAQQSKVGKQTLYRWWKNRAELLIEALLHYAEINIEIPEGDDLQEVLRSFLDNMFQAIRNDTGILLKTLFAESIIDKEILHTFFHSFIIKRQQLLSKIITKDYSILNLDKDKVDLLVDMIFGAMWYRIVFEHRPLDTKFAGNISEIVCKAIL